MKFKLKFFFKDIFLTYIAEFIVLASFFIIYKLIANNFGPEGVGEYSLIKKVFSFFLPITFLGLGVGITRCIAITKDKAERVDHLKIGLIMVFISTSIFLIFINIFKENFAKIFFGTTEYVNLVFPFSIFLIGVVFHMLVYSYFRGYLLIKFFNFFQIINLAIVPIVILVFLKDITIENFIFLIGISTFIIAFIFSLYFIREFFTSIREEQFKNSFKKLVHYSFPRIPGNFALAGILSLSPIVAVHFATIEEVGYLSVSQSLLQVSSVVVAPLGLVLLPKISNLIAGGRQETIKENLNFLIGAVVQCSIFACFQLIIFSDFIIKYWLGPEFLPAVPIMRIIFCSIVFYTFYVSMRSILDATEIKPLNTINLFISLIIFTVVSFILLFLFIFFNPIISLAISFTFSLACLGILTYISIRKIYHGNILKDFKYVYIAVFVNILLGIITVLVKNSIVLDIFSLILFECILGIFYLLILWMLKMEWTKMFFKMIKPN